MLNKKLDKILPKVQKPGRYVGGELNSVIKNKEDVDVRFAFCFPDTYEIGMSHLGIKILYSIFNNVDYIWCERVFAPWIDMEQAMIENDIPLYGLESGDPVSEFDFIGFTLQYELSFTNILNMLKLSGVPLLNIHHPFISPAECGSRRKQSGHNIWQEAIPPTGIPVNFRQRRVIPGAGRRFRWR